MSGDRDRLISTLRIASEIDVVRCRQRAKVIAAWLGLSNLDQIRIATAVSELARNVYQYVGEGSFLFFLEANARGQLQGLSFEARDQGEGIGPLAQILDGSYQSTSGMGVGLRGAQRLMDAFDIESSAAGTRIRGTRFFVPRLMPTDQQVETFLQQLEVDGELDPYQEIREQSEELMVTNAELRNKQQELEATNSELENTNKGVVALYSELEKTAQELKETGEAKGRFFSNMTHELRTPINIISNISKLMLAGSDGELNDEQLKQVRFVNDAAEELSQLVNELLDLAEAQSGRMAMTPEVFRLGVILDNIEQFSQALSMRYPKVRFDLQRPDFDLLMNTDRTRLLQILRNLVSNAFKYTPEGHVSVRCYQPDADQVEFLVEDTGIGISEADQKLIFEEFSRIRSPGLQSIEGTGLGLPLADRLARLLNGSISVYSKPGEGSRFYVQIPRECEHSERMALEDMGLAGCTILMIDDSEADRYLVRRLLESLDPVFLEADSARASIDRLGAVRPDIILLDLDLPDISGEDLLDSMDGSLHERVLINTAKALDASQRAALESRCRGVMLKSDDDYSQRLLQELRRMAWSIKHGG